MDNFPQIRLITTNDYISEINKSIEVRNYMSALVLSLMIPDICSKRLKNVGYVKWFNIYVYRKYYDNPKRSEIKDYYKKSKTYKVKFNGSTCYSLRNAILHSGSPYIVFTKEKDRLKANVDHIELCVNGQSDRKNQYGEAVHIVTYNDMKKSVSIRINIVNFAEKMIAGYKDFLLDNNIDNLELFDMIDWDKKGGKIVFIPNEDNKDRA